MRHILIIDNEELIIEGLATILSEVGDITVSAFKEGELGKQLRETHYTIIFINPDTSTGAELSDKHIITYLQEKAPGSRIVVLGRSLEDDLIADTIQFPVDGFLLKCCKKTEIIKAVQAIEKGEKFFCASVFDKIIANKVKPRETPLGLTEREVEIIRYLCQGKTTLEIADILSRSAHTINTHRKNILKKLKLKNTSELILFAIEKKIIEHGT